MGREGKIEHREDRKREYFSWEFKFGRIREVNNIQGKTRLWENKGKIIWREAILLETQRKGRGI